MRTITLIVLFIFSIGGYIGVIHGEMPFIAGLSISLVLAILSIFVCSSRKETEEAMSKNWVSVFFMFLTGFMIVQFQKYLDLLVLPNMTDTFNVYGNQAIVLKAAYLSLMGLISLLLGYHYQSTHRTFYSIKPLKQYESCSIGTYRIVSFLFFIAVAIFIAINGKLYLTGSYSQEMINMMSGTINAYIVLFVDFMMYACVLVKSILLSKTGSQISFIGYIKSFKASFYIPFLAYLFFVFSSGDRGPIITYLSAFFFGYLLVSKKKVKLLGIIVIFISASIVISILGVARQDVDKNISKSSEYYKTIQAGESILPFTDELANSNRTTIWAIESTPSTFPYRYGLYTINNLIAIIPFSNSILNLIGLDLRYLGKIGNSGMFLDWYSQGDYITAGVGTSTIADLYLDFGPIGVLIILFFLGRLFRKVDFITKTYDISQISLWWLVTGIILFSNAIYMSRSILLSQLRNIVWLFIVMLLILKFGRSNSYE